MKDGEPYRILSGSLHYWRVLPADWVSRFKLIKQMGLNTITTYVNWALHEPQPGNFCFSLTPVAYQNSSVFPRASKTKIL